MLIINELRFLARQPLFWLACLLVPAVSYLFTQGLTPDAASALIQLKLKYVALIMLVMPVYMTIMLPLYFCRDDIHQSFEIVAVTAAPWRSRMLSRIVSFVLSSFLLFVFSFGLVAMLSIWSGQAPNDIGLEILTVNQVVSMSLMFSFSVLLPSIALFTLVGSLMSAKQVSVFSFYIIGIICLVGYLVIASMTGNPILAGSKINSEAFYQQWLWVDPYGITALLSEDRPYVFWLNRLALIVLLAFLLSPRVLYYRGSNKPSDRKKTESKNSGSERRVFWLRNHVFLMPWVELSYRQLGSVVSNKASLLVILLWPLLIFNEVLSGIDYVEPFSSLTPTLTSLSLDAINRINDDVLPVFGSLLIVFWCWQITGAVKSAKFHEIISTAPLANRTFITAYVFSLFCLVIMLLVLTMAGCLLAELVAGSTLDFTIYITELSHIGLTLLLLGAISISITQLVANRVVGTALLILMLILKFTPISGALGATHTLWNVGGTPLQNADRYWGYTDSISVWWPYMQVWLALTFTMLIIASAVSHRGTFFSRGSLLSLSLSRLSLRASAKSLMPLTLIVLSSSTALYLGVQLHKQMVSEKPLTFSKQREEWKAQYEYTYQHWSTKPQPKIEHVDAKIEIYPHLQRARFKLDIRAKNKSAQPINEILIGRYGNMSSMTVLSVSHASQLSGEGEQGTRPALNQTVIVLDKPLEPQDNIQITVSFDYKQPQLWPVSSSTFVKPELTFLRGVPLMPVIGFQRNWTLFDETLRAEFGLAELVLPLPSEYKEKMQTGQSPQYNWVTFETEVSTSSDHHAIAPGKLIDSSYTATRNTFRYVTSHPMRNLPAWVSLPKTDFLVKKAVINAQSKVELYVPELTHFEKYRTDTSDAIEVNLKGVTDTMAFLEKEISPYRYSTLRLFAMPDNGPTGFALPQAMLIGFKVGFLAQPKSSNLLGGASFDQRYRRAVHETAHQWFGHDIGNGNGGHVEHERAFLVESLAKYVELVMIERHYGLDAKQALVDYERQRFEHTQRFNYAKPLSLVDAISPHQQYSQATIVFDELRTVLGDQVILTALRELWREHGYPNQPATSMDFVRALHRQVTDKPEQQAMIDRLLLGVNITKGYTYKKPL